jgi:hypothetical protein
MKKQTALLALVVLSLGSVQSALADDDKWFSRHDRNHDGKWNYDEFRTAHNDYWKRHHDEKRWSNKEMREHWNSLNHDGYVTTEHVRTLHHWD